MEVLREDFAQLVEIIKQHHPALYEFTPKEEYNKLVKQQLEKLTQPLTITQFYQILLPLVTAIGCGHSSLELFEVIKIDSLATVLPLRLVFHQGSGYLLSDYSSDNKLPKGTEITAINGKAIPGLLQQLQTYIATDGHNLSHKREILNGGRFNALLSMEENFPKQYTISYKLTPKDSIQQMVMPALEAQSFYQSYDKQMERDSLLQFSMDSLKKVATLTIKSFGFYDRLDDFKAFIDGSFKQIKEANINHIILDLRGNWGGDPFCSAYLLTYLAKKPIPYFAQSYGGYESLAQPMPLETNPFTGQLYVLIDGLCFSSTGHLSALLKYHQIGEFIGSETHGSYICNDNSERFNLKNTGILVKMARSTFGVAVKGLPRFQGILPNYYIEPTVADWLEGNDPVKHFALQRIEESNQHTQSSTLKGQ